MVASPSVADHLDNKEGVLEAASSKYPVRNRKRNRFIYNDEEETETSNMSMSAARANAGLRSPNKRGVRGSPSKYEPAIRALDKKLAQRAGISLRTLLKLPKAHRWVCYEWFYANIDQPLFLGENDFEAYLKDSFPQLRTRMLRRVEWSKIRRLMGKPRRCSSAFFAEERQALNNRRNKIRHLQQQKVVDINQYRDLPQNIPIPLVIGTKVIALLREPQDGLFSGTVDAVDATNGAYRITFDKPGLGSHSVPDYEVLSAQPSEFMPLSSFQSKVRPRLPIFTSPRAMEMLANQVVHALDHEPLSGTGPTSPSKPTVVSGTHEDGTLGGFPIKFLALLVRLSKILSVKKKKIYELKSMNTEAEKMRSLQEPIPHEFQKQYAGTILDLEKLNIDLNDHLRAVQQYSIDLSGEHGQSSHLPDHMKQKYFVEAKEVVERSLGTCTVKSENTIDVIAQLLSLMLHLKGFADADVSSYELKALGESLQDTRKMLHASNASAFENQVEIHVNHIQSSLSHLGSLGAFSESVVRHDA